MIHRRLVSTVLTVVVFGVLIAATSGDDRRLSIDLWLIGTACWLALSFTSEVLSTAPVDRQRLRLPVIFPERPGDSPADPAASWAGGVAERGRLPFRFSRRWPFLARPERATAVAPRDLQALEGTVLAALDNPRSFSHRLRPRLAAVAEHRLRGHGIDASGDRAAVDATLGDVAWLIGPHPADQPPTVDELTLLLDLTEPEAGPGLDSNPNPDPDPESGA